MCSSGWWCGLGPLGGVARAWGGPGVLLALARAAKDLEDGRRTSRPELLLFLTWGDL